MSSSERQPADGDVEKLLRLPIWPWIMLSFTATDQYTSYGQILVGKEGKNC